MQKNLLIIPAGEFRVVPTMDNKGPSLADHSSPSMQNYKTDLHKLPYSMFLQESGMSVPTRIALALVCAQMRFSRATKWAASVARNIRKLCASSGRRRWDSSCCCLFVTKAAQWSAMYYYEIIISNLSCLDQPMMLLITLQERMKKIWVRNLLCWNF